MKTDKTAVIQKAVDEIWQCSIPQKVSGNSAEGFYCGNGWNNNSDDLQELLGPEYNVKNVNGYVSVYIADSRTVASVRLDKWHAATLSVKWLVCQSHGYLCDYNGTAKGYNWTRHIKAAHVFPSQLEARLACGKIGIEPDAAIAEMQNL